MNDPMLDLAKTVFARAKETGQWDPLAFQPWLNRASAQDWHRLEGAWQDANCPNSFSWDVLRSAIEGWAVAFSAPPLATLGSFLFPPESRTGYEGYWLDWQTDDVKKEVYATAQEWMEQATWALDEQAWMLLHLALSSDSMASWRAAPEKCLAQLDWNKGLYALNGCPLEDLTIADIERIPYNFNSTANGRERPFDKTLIATMLHSASLGWRTVARCIEDKAGPGMWLQYVLDAAPAFTQARRRTAWENMRLDGVDAWALVQWVRPAASFEASFEGMAEFAAVQNHMEWAHQWWLHCVLGMDNALALHLARNIASPVRTPDNLQIDPHVFTSV